jgi:hypothetical protein
MRVRVVVYAPDALTRDVAGRITERFSAERSGIRCQRYSGVMGPLKARQDRSRGDLPEIGVDPPIGTADALIVGAPLEAWGACCRDAPVPAISQPHSAGAGRLRTCTRRYPAWASTTTWRRLSNAFGGPETVIVSQRDMDGAGQKTPRGLAAFLDSLEPTVEIRLMPVMMPIRAA